MGNKLRHEGDEVRIKVIWPDKWSFSIAMLNYQRVDLLDRWWTQRFISRVVKGGLMVVASRCRCCIGCYITVLS